MLSAEALVDQLQHGRLPDHWRVVKGGGFPLTAAPHKPVFCLLGWLLGAGLYFLGRGTISNYDYGPFIVGTAIVFIIVLFQAWRWGQEAQHSFLILEPEGFLLLTHSNSPSKCLLRTYLYSSITAIDLKLRSPVNLTKNAEIRMQISTANGTFWVDLDSRFGSPFTMAQTILITYAQYRALHPYGA